MAEEDKTWTIKRCLDWTRDYLGGKGDEHPRLSAEWLLCAATGKDRTGLYMAYDEPLAPDELDLMHGYVVRRASGEPLQYVTGRTTFRFVDLSCAPGVLIPRPETELLVDAVLEAVDEAGAGARVLEVGCGTGCVSLALASERPGTRMVATDISPDACALAKRNRDELGLSDAVEIVECDLAGGVEPSLMGTFAALVSNPPYIPTAVMATLPPEVADFEPGLALDGGTDGLDVFRRLLDLAPRALAPGGMLAVELFEESLDDAARLVRGQEGWASVEVREDLTHRPRMLVARREGALAPVAGGEHVPEGRIVTCSQLEPEEEVLDDATAVLSGGGVVVMPTDSVYGIGAAAREGNPGHARIFDIKRRERSQTLPLLLADPEDLDRYACDLPAYARELAVRHWPGALTLVVRASDEVGEEFRRDGTVALRVPDSPLVRELARRQGCPLAVTSANTHGFPAPATSDDIERRIADLADLTLAAGPTPGGVPSTIVSCAGPEPAVIRK